MAKLICLAFALTITTVLGCPILQLNIDNYNNFCASAPAKAVRHYALTCTEPICRKHFIDCETPNNVRVLPCLPGLPYEGEGKVCYWRVKISVRSEACSDPGIDRSIRPCGTASIVVDGTERSLKQRGHNIVILDYRTGEYIQSVAFDTHGDISAAGAMKGYVGIIPDNCIVIVALQDEGGKAQSSRSVEALEILGASRGSIAYRESFVMIGYKGVESVSWITEVRHPPAFGPSVIDDAYISLY